MYTVIMKYRLRLHGHILLIYYYYIMSALGGVYRTA